VTALQRRITNLTREDNVERSAGDNNVTLVSAVVGWTVMIRMTEEVLREAVSWVEPAEAP